MHKELYADETAARVNLGLQCPECYGLEITESPRQPHDYHRFTCEGCGCQWSEKPA